MQSEIMQNLHLSISGTQRIYHKKAVIPGQRGQLIKAGAVSRNRSRFLGDLINRHHHINRTHAVA